MHGIGIFVLTNKQVDVLNGYILFATNIIGHSILTPKSVSFRVRFLTRKAILNNFDMYDWFSSDFTEIFGMFNCVNEGKCET